MWKVGWKRDELRPGKIGTSAPRVPVPISSRFYSRGTGQRLY